MDAVNRGLSISENEAFTAANNVLNSILPDNDNFTAVDASEWEVRLGLIVNPAVPLVDRKLAILRKMNHPGTIPARQHHLYLQGQLQDAGFNVFVFENKFPIYLGGFETKNPLVVDPTGEIFFQHGPGILHGNIQHGKTYNNIVANKIDEGESFTFGIGNLRRTFFIGDNPFGTKADVDIARKDEFRQLILKIKPVQTVGILLINYV